MRSIVSVLTSAVLLALTAPVSAQTLQPPVNPPPMQAASPSGFTSVSQPQTQTPPPWMQDDGSSSDHPLHNPGDFSADGLNSQVRGGIPVPPGQGFPAEGLGR